MKWVRDTTGRVSERPHYTAAELETECDDFMSAFLNGQGRAASYPIATNDLVVLLESLAADLDIYADLSAEGEGVEGVTYFDPSGGKPVVRIAAHLAEDRRRENRFRTTLSHEIGHVRLHSFIWRLDPATRAVMPRCQRKSIVRAPQSDWMEWQAAYVSGALLMPRTEIEGVVRETRLAHGRDEAVLVREVKGRFAVSAEAAQVRLLQTGLLEHSTRVVGVSRQRDWFRRPARSHLVL